MQVENIRGKYAGSHAEAITFGSEYFGIANCRENKKRSKVALLKKFQIRKQ